MSGYLHFTSKIKSTQIGQRLDKALVSLLPNYSRTQIKHFIINGLVKINGIQKFIAKEKINGNETVDIKINIQAKNYWPAENIKLNIVYEDDDIIVINKPHNLVVHPGIGNYNGTLLNAILHYFPPIKNIPRAGIIHRLDKNTTGLIIIAKNIIAQHKLIKSLRLRYIIREYQAIVVGNIISGGTIDLPISRHPFKRTRMKVNLMGKKAITHYRIIKHFRASTWIQLRLETGRTHQIRVHMSHINHALIGDPLYGSRMQIPCKASDNLRKTLYNFRRQALHATFLKFYHPITLNEMELHAPLPKDMLTLISAIEEDDVCFKNYYKY